MAKSLARKREVKLQLAAKYERLAKNTNSQPKRKTFQYHAQRFRHQAAAIAQMLDEQAKNQA